MSFNTLLENYGHKQRDNNQWACYKNSKQKNSWPTCHTFENVETTQPIVIVEFVVIERGRN